MGIYLKTYTFTITPQWILLQMINISETFSEKIKTQILCCDSYFIKSWSLRDNMEKSGTAGQATNDNIIQGRQDAICMQHN